MAFYALIMAGGTGTRLWPASRRDRPKQTLELIGDRTMFEHTVDRITPVFPPDHVFVVAGREHVSDLADQAPELPAQNLIVEPLGRGTAPAIGLGAIHLQHKDPDAVMAVLTADHFIADVERFQRVLEAAAEAAREGHLVTLGIEPSSPSTGYGYIQQGAKMECGGDFDVFQVERFTEKPDQETALRMAESGEYTWNSGMFVWSVDRIMTEFQCQMPDFYVKLAEVQGTLGTDAYGSTLKRIWPTINKQSIDYGVMEGAGDVAVIPVDIGWSDVGSWGSLAELLAELGEEDEDGNVIVGDHIGIDTQRTMVFGSERLIATIGLEDMVIVDVGDAVLVCPMDREQDVRELVHLLERQESDEYL